MQYLELKTMLCAILMVRLFLCIFLECDSKKIIESPYALISNNS